MRRLLVPVVAALALALASTALAEPLFVIKGRGWGHGIGMSQYGAYGFAKRGWTYERILGHYYRGTDLATARDRRVRVLLATGRGSLTVGSDAAFRVVDARGRSYALRAGRQDLGPGLRVRTGGGEKVLADPATFHPGAEPLRLDGRPYRGALVVASSRGSLSAVNRVGLEPYLYGVVPWEMPSNWSLEALKAQAVAARSYALVSIRGSGSFDLYADTRSQVYGGIEAENRRTNVAVDATAGKVVTYRGAVAHTFYHSTSGGRTAAIHHVWPAAKPIPYLVSVPDPYDTLSPYHRWGPLALTGAQARARLGSSAPRGLSDLRVRRNGSGRAASVLARGAGGTSEILASAFQAALELRSTWFQIGVLSLSARSSPVVYGERAVLTGRARGLGRTVLEARTAGRSWRAVGVVPRGSGGRFAVVLRPRTSASYRLAAGGAKGLVRRVLVAARVNFYPYEGGDILAGVVRPAVAGSVVGIQRRTASGSWRTVATTTADGRGVWRVRFAGRPGSYRARAVVPGRGLVPGISPTLRLVRG